MNRNLSFFLISLFVLGALLGCTQVKPSSPPSQSESPVKNEIFIGLAQKPKDLNPLFLGDNLSSIILDNIYEPLFKLDGFTLKTIPCLGTDFEILDELSWAISLRQEVKFHDGSPFTAEDALYSLNRVLKSDYFLQYPTIFDTIERVELINKTTLGIYTTDPDPLLLKRLTKVPMVSQTFNTAETNDPLKPRANGTGPYFLSPETSDEEIILNSFSDYWDQEPFLQRASFFLIPQGTQRVSQLKSGDLDLALDLEAELISDLDQVFPLRGQETSWIRFNQLSGPMMDVNLRLAANYALDLETLAIELFQGYGRPTEGQIGRYGQVGYSNKVSSYPYDLDKAQELLAASDYENEPLELVSLKNHWPKGQALTQAVAAQLRKAGFNIEVKFLSWQEWLDRLFDQNQAPNLQFSYTKNELFDLDQSYSNLVHTLGPQSTLANSTYDDIIEKAKTELDADKRQGLYDKLAQDLHQDPFGLYLLTEDSLHGGSSKLNWPLRQDGLLYLAELSFTP